MNYRLMKKIVLVIGICALAFGCTNKEQQTAAVADEVQAVEAGVMGDEVLTVSDSTLYVVDDKEVTKEEVSGLNRDSIASVTVLKDSAGIALYGEKGKNGVVYIKTKKGGEGSEDAGDASK